MEKEWQRCLRVHLLRGTGIVQSTSALWPGESSHLALHPTAQLPGYHGQGPGPYDGHLGLCGEEPSVSPAGVGFQNPSQRDLSLSLVKIQTLKRQDVNGTQLRCAVSDPPGPMEAPAKGTGVPEIPPESADTSIEGTVVLETCSLEGRGPSEITLMIRCQTETGREHQVLWNVNKCHILRKNSSISEQITWDM